MAAYAAVVSLRKTIERILRSSRISPEIIRLALRELKPLQDTLKLLDSSDIGKSRKKINGLDGRIKDAVWRFEDLLESHLSDQILDLQGLRDAVQSFNKTVKDMKEEYIYELDNMAEEENESVSSRIGSGGIKSKMVGLFDQFRDARDFVRKDLYSMRAVSYSLVGMAGIGKTALAKKIFEDPLIVRDFKSRAWIRVGRKYEMDEIGDAIRAQLTKQGSMEGKSCLVVLDDVWDTRVLDYFKTSFSRRVVILLTTRLRRVSLKSSHELPVMRLLTAEESKELLCEKVFGEKSFPSKLEKVGKKIAENCEGLPLMVVTIANHLSKADKTPEYWEEVAKKRNSVFRDAYGEISEVLFPSYNYLPQHLKMFFLYLGVFPQDYEIPTSKLINMLTVEGFIEPYKSQTLEEYVRQCLKELELCSLLIYNQRSMDWFMKLNHSIKSCRLHSSWWHFCKGEARENKFFHVLIDPVDDSDQVDVKGQRRLCVHNNILFAYKDVNNLVECECASTARSLLCFGPYHQYPVPIYGGLNLLRVLDALTIRFYDFPIDILKLGLLQYLALTYNGKLPPSISELSNLHFLIIHPHMNIRFCGAPTCMPDQIWDMKELRHIEVLGSSLPNPNFAASMEKLSVLLGVSVNNNARGVLKRIPNIRKLGIQFELTPDEDDSDPLAYFDHISELKNLETLKCSIVNPEVKYGLTAPMVHLSMFPSGLRKLHLSGFNYPWKYMDVIGSLPNLEVLKLRCYAFRGPSWEIKSKSFLRLKFLLIEDTDLVQWKPSFGSFQCLTCLSLKHCYKLKELHWPSENRSYGRIEIVDCNPLAIACAQQLEKGYQCDRLDVTATWLKRR